MTIRSRLLLLVLAVLLPAVAIAMALIARTCDSERAANENTLRETTRALSTLIDRELAQRASVARALSLLPELDAAPDIAPAMLASFEQQVRRALGGMQGWVELGLPPGSAALALPTDPSVLRLLPSTEAVTSARVLPLARNTATASSGVGGDLRAGLLHPVVREGNHRVNLTVTVLPGELQRTLDEQRLPAHWTGAVVDSAGTVAARQPGGQAHAGRPATADLQGRLASGREGLFDSVDLDGVAVVAYSSTAVSGWTFVNAMPRDRFARRMPSAVRNAALASLLLLGLAVGGALWVSRRIESSVHALERSVADAVALTRAAEQRQSQSQRVEALGRLTGGVAHDFNNLLGVIGNSTYLIERQVAAQPALAAPVAAVLRAVDLGSRLTQHLVRFAERRPVRPRSLALERFLPEMHELLAAALGKRVRLSTQVAPGTWPVVADASEFELALMSLALNARDAIVGTGQLWLQARNAGNEDTPGLTPGRYVLVTVNDDGQGVVDDFTANSVGKGVGLGLPQVHGFAVQAGGTVLFHSTPGLGTTVSLLLPAAPVVEPGTPAQASASALALAGPAERTAQPEPPA